MLASCARRNGGRLLLAALPRFEAASAQLLEELINQHQGGWGSAPAAAGAWAAAPAAAPPAAWTTRRQCGRPFTASATSLLSTPGLPSSSSSREPESSSSSREPESRSSSSGASGSGGGAADGDEAAAAAAAASTSRPATGTWLDRLPASWVPYAQLMRLEKPIGTWLLAWPCFWSIALAAPPGTPPDLRMLALFGAGSLLLRGAGAQVVLCLWTQRAGLPSQCCAVGGSHLTVHVQRARVRTRLCRLHRQ